MRYLLLAAMLAASCGPDYNGCQNVCAGGMSGETRYLCDGGLCPVGSGSATLYDQCLCTTTNDQAMSLVYQRPQDLTECDAAKANWLSFFAANCH